MTSRNEIPIELRNPTKSVVPTTGFRKGPEMEHHDPSNVVFHAGEYFVWFTELHKDTDGFRAGYINYATSPNGLHWHVRGIALDKGAADGPDAQGVLTPYVVPTGGKWYLFFLAADGAFNDPRHDSRGIWLAEADSPHGPWAKRLESPILWPGEEGEWDELCCDDPNVIFREGKWWLYYKGRQRGSRRMNSSTGLALADSITGPYEKHPRNPLMSGHAASAWVHRDGVAAVGGEADPPEAQRIRWSEDGVHFVEAGHFPNKSTGFFCPEDFEAGVNMRGVTWGIDVMPGVTPRYLYRFDCTMTVQEEAEQPVGRDA
jgi:predicted GH43/DUF377 family glycosyl hydrolase